MSEWTTLLQSSSNLNYQNSKARINRSLKGIEKEAQRLSSKSSHHIPSNQLKDFALSFGVDIRNQTQYISSIHTLPSSQQIDIDEKHEKHEKYEKNLQESIPLISGSYHPKSSMDLNNYLKYHHEYIISSTIQECQLLSSNHFRKKYIESTENEWNKTKIDILNYFGCNQQIQEIQHKNMDIDIDIDDINIDIDINIDLELEQRFNLIIYDLSYIKNETTPLMDFDRNINNNNNNNNNNNQFISRQNIFPPILSIATFHREIYEKIKLKLNGERKKKEEILLFEYLIDLWQCLSSMIFETGINNKKQYLLQPNIYKNNLNKIGLQQLFVNGAKQYLEKMYFEFIEKEIEKNKNFAKKGGKPGKRYIIKAFVRLKYQINNNNNNNLIPNEYKKINIENEIFPLWPLIFYSFRIGDIDSCLYFAKFDNSSNIIYQILYYLREEIYKFNQQTFNLNIIEIINKFENNFICIKQELWKKLDSFYKENIMKKSNDPFEHIMYILIGKFFTLNFENYSEIISNQVLNRSEDYLWFKLSTLYFTEKDKPNWMEDNNNNNNSIYRPSIGLNNLQFIIKSEIGISNFDNNILFIISLILTQQFDDAINYLSKYYPLQSIHLGICLNYYGLLTNTTNINLTKNIIHYLKNNKNNNKNIFYYLYIINGDNNLFANFLCESNKNLRQLMIGKINRDSILIKDSLIYKYFEINRFIEICNLSAIKSYENGEIEHCIILYILCGNFNQSSLICLKLLSSHICDKFNNDSKQFIINLAKQIYKINQNCIENNNYHSINNSQIIFIDNKNNKNLIYAIHFAEFYDLYYLIQKNDYNQYQQIENALNIINTNDLIPINDEIVIKLNENKLSLNDDIIIPFKNKILNNLDVNLKKYIGDILNSIMNILIILFEKYKINQQIENLQIISTKCFIIYNFFNALESDIKPLSTNDIVKNISNLYFKTRI